MKSERGKVESLCMRSSIIYIELGKDSKILEILDIEGIKSVLRILTQTEGCIFVQNRTRMIEITLANLDVLIQAKYLFEKLNIPTKDIRKDFSGGYQRYKLSISTKNNLKKFGEVIGFVENSQKQKNLKRL